ncbi:MAG: ATP-binding cassette domain-containing protein [Arcobacteraceae bacterium]
MSKKSIIEIKNLTHFYGQKKIYDNLNLSIQEGCVFGILGKNGVGKSTLINILMGYLQPKNGQCLIFGEDSHNLSYTSKKDIALLHEGFVAYDFMTISQYEDFFAPFYVNWNKKVFYDLVDLMGLDYSQKLSTLSFGQKSQVVLGAIFAQDAKLLILDDYSMGLDAGYRRLFINYLKNYIKEKSKTVIITSHTMNDLDGLLDEFLIVQKGAISHHDTMENFNLDKSSTFEDKFLDFVGLY